MKTIPLKEQQTKITTGVCTIEDLINAYGNRAEKISFCRECVEYKTCQGTLSECPYKKYYIENEVKNSRTNIEAKRRTYKRWTAEEEQELISLVKQGYFTKEIGKKLDRNKDVVYAKMYILRKRGIEMNREREPKYDWSKYDNQIIAYRKEGKSFAEISRIISIPTKTITYHVRQLKKKGVIPDVDDRANKIYYRGR